MKQLTDKKKKGWETFKLVLIGTLVELFYYIGVPILAGYANAFAENELRNGTYSYGFMEWITSFLMAFFMLQPGILIATLLGGILPGAIVTALTLFIVCSMSGNIVVILLFTVPFVIAVFIRKRRIIEKKYGVLIISLTILLHGIILCIATKDYLNITSFIAASALIFVFLNLIKKMLSKYKKIFPTEKRKGKRAYRKISVKSKILIVLNVSLLCLSTAFSVLSINELNQQIISSRSSQYDKINFVFGTFLADEINELNDTDSLDKLTDKDSLLWALATDLADSNNYLTNCNIEKMAFYHSQYTMGFTQLGEPIGYIDFEYNQYVTSSELIDVKAHYTVPQLSDKASSQYLYGDGNGYISVIYDITFVDETDITEYILEIISLALILIAITNVLAIWIMNKLIVDPVNNMTSAASGFAFTNEENREKFHETFTALDIKSGDEIEQLYLAFNKTISDMDDYVTQIKEKSEQISEIQHNIILTMADIVESRDENTGGHIRRTAAYVEIISKKLREQGKFTDILTPQYESDMIVAAPLHDMGKIHVSDTILNKPGRLTDEEFGIMKSHTTAGKDMLENATNNLGVFSYLTIAVQMAAYHHEWWNGRGYPEGLSGNDIPLCARIMAVADVFDALMSKRCYKDAMPIEKAYSIIREETGTHFDPDVAEAFFAASAEIEACLNSME